MKPEELSKLAERAGLELRMEEEGLTLTDGVLSVRADLSQDLKRLGSSELRRELLVRAALGRKAPRFPGLSPEAGSGQNEKGSSPLPEGLRPVAIDATAGLGEDSLLLAAAGYLVHLFEINPLIAALLEDGLERAKRTPGLDGIAERMELHTGDSIKLMPMIEAPELILLDPMFPARKKSGLVKKKFQLLQRLEQPCANEFELLQAAVAASPAKIIIKRPLRGPFLGGMKPSYSIEGSTICYDCIVLQPRIS